MPLDPSIALQGRPPDFMSPAQMISLRNIVRQGQLQQLQIAEAQRQQQVRAQTQQALQAPGATDQFGPTLGTLGKIAGMDIPTYTQLLGARGAAEKGAAEAQNIEYQGAERRASIGKENARSAVQAFDQAMKDKPGDVQNALRVAKEDEMSSIQEDIQNGKWHGAGFPEGFDRKVMGEPMTIDKINQMRSHFFTPAETQKMQTGEMSPFQKEAAAEYGYGTPAYHEAMKNRLARETSPTLTQLTIAAPGKSEIPPQAEGKTGASLLPYVPADIRDTANKVANYEMNPQLLSNRRGVGGESERERVLRWAARLNPDYDDTQYQAKRKAVQAFATGPQGNQTRFLNVSIDHLTTAREYAKALQAGDYPAINRLTQAWQTQTGQAAPNTFEGIRDIVADEVVKGVIGSPGGVTDRSKNAEKVRAANSPAQMEQLFDGWEKLLAGQMKGLEKQYEAGTGLKNFRQKYLAPRTLEALDKAAAAPTTPAKVSPYSDPDKEKRYQEWKRAHGYE